MKIKFYLRNAFPLQEIWNNLKQHNCKINKEDYRFPLKLMIIKLKDKYKCIKVKIAMYLSQFNLNKL